jgi:flavin reductase (DIM6/NTAB) family NADH-FMN oxidoreductase RutF
LKGRKYCENSKHSYFEETTADISFVWRLVQSANDSTAPFPRALRGFGQNALSSCQPGFSDMTDMHFYEPRNGHRLPHDPFNAIVGPRPIGWIGSRGNDGALNLAPYSFFNAFNYTPPIIGFASIGAKDTLRNIEQTREFTWNLVTQPLAEAMNATCAPVAPGVSEFALAGLTPVASSLIDVPRVGESRVAFECRCTQIVQLQGADGVAVPTWLVLGEVVGVHIAPDALVDGVYDTASAGHVLRAGGPADYFSVGPEQLFKMDRPR